MLHQHANQSRNNVMCITAAREGSQARKHRTACRSSAASNNGTHSAASATRPHQLVAHQRTGTPHHYGFLLLCMGSPVHWKVCLSLGRSQYDTSLLASKPSQNFETQSSMHARLLPHTPPSRFGTPGPVRRTRMAMATLAGLLLRRHCVCPAGLPHPFHEESDMVRLPRGH